VFSSLFSLFFLAVAFLFGFICATLILSAFFLYHFVYQPAKAKGSEKRSFIVYFVAFLKPSNLFSNISSIK
jgi:hypothetical protein